MSHASRVKALSGQTVAPSRWVLVDQAAINLFADATLDHQWIHTDPERAARESPFGATVAHGMFTASLAPPAVPGGAGADRGTAHHQLRVEPGPLPAPLRAGTRVRLNLQVGEVIDVTGGVRATLHASMEAEGSERPVCVAEFLLQIGHG